MFENKITDRFLKIIPHSTWNQLSNVVAQFSFPAIGSPISFNYNDFSLKEFDLLKSDETRKKQFLDFCYPLEASDRKKEIEIDYQYWVHASTFIITDKNDVIKGCAQYIPKKGPSRIPAEYAAIADNSGTAKYLGALFDKNISPNDRYAEIYRCRRSFDLKSSDAFSIVYILFKALWAKIIQESNRYIFITFDPENKELHNLYIKRLCFQDLGIFVRFGNGEKKWKLLVKDCLYQENELAKISRSHFFMQTWFRKNLKKKNLRIQPAHKPVTARLFPENGVPLFTRVVPSGLKQSRVRRRILERKAVK